MRDAVSEVTGVMAVMPLTNINTDSIIPSIWLRSAHSDFGKGLFGGLRYAPDGSENPNFVLNQPPYRNASILLSDENFGCGSSREAAVWALMHFGIRCVLAPSFADIFYENAFRNGLVPGLIDADTMKTLARIAVNQPGPFHVDLRMLEITGPDGSRHDFRMPPARTEALIMGYDEIDMTLRHDKEIDAYYASSRAYRSWLFPIKLGAEPGA